MVSSRTIFITVPIILGLFALVFSDPVQDNLKFSLRIAQVDGTARIKNVGSEGWVAMDKNTSINPGDSLVTLEDSRLEIVGLNLMVTRFGAFSTVHYPSKYFPSTELVSGSMWLKGSYPKSAGKPLAILPSFILESGGGVARVTAGDDCSTEIKIYSGNFTLKNRIREAVDSTSADSSTSSHPCGGKASVETEIVLKEGTKIVISSDGSIVYNGAFSPDDPDEQTDWVKWNKDRDKSIKAI